MAILGPVQADRPALDAGTKNAAQVFIKRVEGRCSIVAAILYGSRARGDHMPDSDADLAIILEGERGDRYETAGEMAGVAFDVMLKTGILVRALPLWEDEWDRPERFNNPALIENIAREGRRL